MARKYIKSSLNYEHEQLIQWFRTVKFKKVLIGGVDESQLWKKLEELNDLYEASLRAERARYDALILEERKACNAKVHKYKQELETKSQIKTSSGPVDVKRRP
ncbi:MAG: hypothetical protein ACI4F1_08380 [Bariatricus sp.]